MNIKKIMSIAVPAGIGFVAGMLTSEAVMKISTLTKKNELMESSEESDTIEDDDELQIEDFIIYPDEDDTVEEKKTVLDAVDEIEDDDEDYIRYKQERNRRQIEKMKEAKKHTVIEYNNILKSNGYKTESQDDDIIDDDLLEIEEEYEDPIPDYDVSNTESYVISPDEYMTVSGYTSMSLIYHSDNVITDEEGSVIEDPDATLMPDIRSHFGEYELDTVYIRNESRQVEYEILWDDEPFGEET